MADSFREEMEKRTLQFSLRVIRLYAALKKQDEESRIIGKQLLRSATSIGANYREACHGRSRADFVARLKICESEAAETSYWLELIDSAGLAATAKLAALRQEADELVAIFASGTKSRKPDA